MKKQRCKNLADMPVQKSPCRTCPFEGSEPVDLTPEAYKDYIEAIVKLRSQHLCHSAQNQAICRGGRNLTLRVMCTKGLIEEPTDQAFDRVRRQILGF